MNSASSTAVSCIRDSSRSISRLTRAIPAFSSHGCSANLSKALQRSRMRTSPVAPGKILQKIKDDYESHGSFATFDSCITELPAQFHIHWDLLDQSSSSVACGRSRERTNLVGESSFV